MEYFPNSTPQNPFKERLTSKQAHINWQSTMELKPNLISQSQNRLPYADSLHIKSFKIPLKVTD